MSAELAEAGETKKLDAVGIGLSVFCAIHCLSIPLLMGVLPVAGLGFVANHEFEWVMTGIIFSVAAFTYAQGFRRHGHKGVFVFLVLGTLVFVVVRPFVTEQLHPVATIVGGLIFVAGHWKNWHWHRQGCPKPCCSSEH